MENPNSGELDTGTRNQIRDDIRKSYEMLISPFHSEEGGHSFPATIKVKRGGRDVEV